MYIFPFYGNSEYIKFIIERIFIMKNIKTLFLSVSILAGIILSVFFSSNDREFINLQKSMSEKIIRFHIRANSDSKEDQQLKLQVKDAVVNYLSEPMSRQKTKQDSLLYIHDHLEDIKNIALSVLARNGCNYTVEAYITNEFFPTKVYGKFTFPCGDYDAFRIDIGESQGKNWWCLLFPPLCFIDETYGIVSDSSVTILKNVLDEDEFSYISGEITNSDLSFDFKFFDFFN